MNDQLKSSTSRIQGTFGIAQQAQPTDAPDQGEIMRESQGVDQYLSYLEERLTVLENRLNPVLIYQDEGKSGECTASLVVSSQIGQQLRGYSNRAESAAARVNNLLRQLALP